MFFLFVEIVAAMRRSSLQLVVLQVGESDFRGAFSVVNLEAFPSHLIMLEKRVEAAFFKLVAMRDERQSFDFLLYLIPYLREDWRVIGVFFLYPVNLARIEIVKVRHGLHEAVELLDDLAVTHNNDAHAAYARGLFVGSFEVDGDEVGEVGQDVVIL